MVRAWSAHVLRSANENSRAIFANLSTSQFSLEPSTHGLNESTSLGLCAAGLDLPLIGGRASPGPLASTLDSAARARSTSAASARRVLGGALPADAPLPSTHANASSFTTAGSRVAGSSDAA
eukprot:366380-Chlamydomonas_euryale.AAC.17